MLRPLPFILLATATASLAADKAPDSLAGRYYRQFPNSFVSGEKYTGEDIVEIVPVGPGAAYVRIHLDYYNGHSCGIYGIAKAEAGALVYREVRDPSAVADGRQCVLTVSHSGKSLSIDDAEGSCRGYCGARGTLTQVTLPYASKRPIRYMARLKASDEFKAAQIEWRTGKPYEPWKEIKPLPDSPRQPM
jgi:hypothetical protein